MGRKIPKSRRHKKLKSVDPFRKDAGAPKQDDPRANRPPKNLEQEVPRSFKVLFDGMNDDEEPEKRRRKRKASKNLISVQRCKMESEQRGMTRPLKPLPERLEQQPNESDDQFLKRLDHLAGTAFTEAKIENRFNVRIDRDEQGNTVVNPKGGDVLDESYGARKRAKRKLREQKLKEKKRQKLSTRQQQSDFGHLKDQVAFGEVVHHPPDITAHVRKADSTKLSKPGKKELLLTKMLTGDTGDKPDLTVKRKELSVGDRKRLEVERERAIFLYRKMKAEAVLRRASAT
ncbi:coiled-coil domain-containing protein 137 isoform X2 [Dermacentor silvarum]|uniref:coiled-coil domain-containing protein 137 isoform X2 n=2 Tax=Dermacentor silvarum TaxID=543639 RepID=UPI001897DAF0|nr:coiled-coil domain-containing protein 137 isoform X2 [Dermacentor silvarum]